MPFWVDFTARPTSIAFVVVVTALAARVGGVLPALRLTSRAPARLDDDRGSDHAVDRPAECGLGHGPRRGGLSRWRTHATWKSAHRREGVSRGWQHIRVVRGDAPSTGIGSRRAERRSSQLSSKAEPSNRHDNGTRQPWQLRVTWKLTDNALRAALVRVDPRILVRDVIPIASVGAEDRAVFAGIGAALMGLAASPWCCR